MPDERANLLAKVRLLRPDINLGITDEDWKNWKNWMDDHKGKSDVGILAAWLGANLTILAAEDARLENGQIKITKKIHKTDPVNPLPEERSF
jgi:hypothetical protein